MSPAGQVRIGKVPTARSWIVCLASLPQRPQQVDEQADERPLQEQADHPPEEALEGSGDGAVASHDAHADELLAEALAAVAHPQSTVPRVEGEEGDDGEPGDHEAAGLDVGDGVGGLVVPRAREGDDEARDEGDARDDERDEEVDERRGHADPPPGRFGRRCDRRRGRQGRRRRGRRGCHGVLRTGDVGSGV
ncbi:MAG: hypothetical protein PGN15_13585 [Aeromicrobium erythreum]